MEGAPCSTSAAGEKKAQFMLVDNFVCNVLTVKYPFLAETPALKDIEKGIIKVMTECDSLANKEYRLLQNLDNYTSICKSILDRRIYCNQEAIARKALAMYKERLGDGDIKTLIEEYNLYKIAPTKLAGLWEPPSVRMKRHTSMRKMPRNKFADLDKESFKEVCEGDPAQDKHLLQHIENQDWLNLIIAWLLGEEEWSEPLR